MSQFRAGAVIALEGSLGRVTVGYRHSMLGRVGGGLLVSLIVSVRGLVATHRDARNLKSHLLGKEICCEKISIVASAVLHLDSEWGNALIGNASISGGRAVGSRRIS